MSLIAQNRIFETRDADNAGRALPYVAVSGTSTYRSLPMRGDRKGFLSFGLDWTGTPTGTFTLWISSQDHPPEDSDTGWKQVTGWVPTNPAGTASGEEYSISDVKTGWARIKYVNASGSGNLSGSNSQ